MDTYFGRRSMKIGLKKYTSQKEVPSSTPASDQAPVTLASTGDIQPPGVTMGWPGQLPRILGAYNQPVTPGDTGLDTGVLRLTPGSRVATVCGLLFWTLRTREFVRADVWSCYRGIMTQSRPRASPANGNNVSNQEIIAAQANGMVFK